ncbi:Fe-Mn family superoxide dismutase [Luteimonas sp. MJ293]|uniref:superoxide dismutase n=1 Tax=Luteimonas sp. MJ146 TaxID=3129240 RepID=UPI0031BBCC94
MPFELPALPYERTALEPHLSGETLDLHHGHLQRGHLERLEALAADTVFAEMALEDIARKGQGAMAECAAQAWAMELYWSGLKAPAEDSDEDSGGGEPQGKLADAIKQTFGSLAGLQKHFNEASLRSFGPGWAWLLQRTDGRLAIAVTPHSVTPLTGTDRVLLACSLWEHAYVLDYRDDRGKYLEAFWQLVDWDAVSARMG